jgi:DNA-binding transcriptional ArsR family regulator
MRLIADVRPPYTVSQLAEATGLAPGYVSQLLDSLYREALIERAPRGPVESVNVSALLKRWAQSYDVLKSNRSYTYVAPMGFEDLLERFVEEDLADRLVLTGSIAASRLAPVAASAIVMAYCDNPSGIAQRLGLLPADEGANVILLEPFDSTVWDRTKKIENGLRFAAPSQIVVDCLAGAGRMPAEGEALLNWMQSNESKWRLPSLDALAREAR